MDIATNDIPFAIMARVRRSNNRRQVRRRRYRRKQPVRQQRRCRRSQKGGFLPGILGAILPLIAKIF